MSKTIAALNEAMKEIIAVNPDNRVGMITFSSIRADGSGGNNGIHGCEFLPLSAYDSISLSFEGNDNLGKGESAQAGATITVKGVNGRSTSSKTMNVYGATYTQYGIYLAYEMLNSATDKEGRIPIVILLTDGEPTVYTRSYNDVGNTNASVIGDLGSGHSTTGEYQGYYTVLSASYYKEKIAGLYTDENGQNLSREDVRFYNIGIDLANDTGNTSCSHFRKMIVSPSLETLDDVISCNHTRHETYYKELCTLLNDNQSLWYEYCDKYENMDNLTLREGIEAFIKMMVAQEINIIANPLEAGTNITFIDNIGEGMELKEAPILRYNGLNYTVSSKSVSDNVTTYTYSGSVNVSGKSNGDKVELSLMEVKVISNTDGTTTVEWIIPVELVPLMLRSSATEVLYDILPMRLIMRVGPNATGEAILEEGVPIYTNNWNAGSETKVIYTPSAVNVYYASNYQEIVNKDEMVSKTSATYYSASNSEGTVTALLGNNGKLVNISKYTLPATGGNGVNIYYFVGLLTIILCFTYMVLYNKSKANNCGKEMK